MKKSIWIRFLEWMEAFAYRKADRIVVVSGAFVDHIEKRAGAGHKVAVIPNGVDLQFFSPTADGSNIRMEAGLDDKFVVAYVGTFGMAHGLDTVLDAAELLRDTPQVAFLLVGDGAERAQLLKRREVLGLANVVIMEQQPKRRMPEIWAAADVGMVLLRDQPVFRLVIPSKMFEAMATRTPVILGVRGESQRILQASGGGIMIPPEDPVALARTVRELARNPERCRALGEAGRHFVEENYGRRVLAREYQDLLEALVEESRAVVGSS